MSRLYALLSAVLLLSMPATATIFGTVRGLVHDPQHRPIAGAKVVIKAAGSDWQQTASTNAAGEFQLAAVPVGEYSVTVSAPGFAVLQQAVTVTSGNLAILHFPLALAKVTESVQVSETPASADTESSTASTMIESREIAHTPGADRANSVAMITDFVPGAYVVHDQPQEQSQ